MLRVACLCLVDQVAWLTVRFIGPMNVIGDQNKYALVGFPTNRLAADLPAVVELPGFLAFRRLPLTLPQHWQEWLGSLAMRQIQEEGLYLIAQTSSKRLNVDDAESEALRGSVHGLYWCLLLSTSFFWHERGLLLSGSRDKDDLRVQHRQEYPRLPWTPYAPRTHITEGTLRNALALAEGVSELLKRVGSVERLSRANGVFARGLESPSLGDRTLAFVRTVEAFLLPPVGSAKEAFIERAGSFIVGG
jgi:hypothetical protein